MTNPYSRGFAPASRTEWCRATKKWLGLSWAELAEPLGMSPNAVANLLHPERLPLWFCHYLSARVMGWAPRDWPQVPQRVARDFYLEHAPKLASEAELVGVPLQEWAHYARGEAARYRARILVMVEAYAHGHVPSPMPFTTWEP